MKDPIKLRTVFMGTSRFADTILSALIESKYNIVAIYTQPDKKVGRNKEPKKGTVKETAEKSKIEIFQPKKFDEEAISSLRNLKPDLIIVSSYGKILPPEILNIPGFGAINTHASLLPRFRGPSPIQNALLQGETETGTTIMLMDAGIDTGEILVQKSLPIDSNETQDKLSEKLATLSVELLLKTIPLWIERKIKPQKQDDSRATLCQLIERSDGKIIWADSAREIYNRYRAFFPWPGIFSHWEKDGFNQRIKFNKISLLDFCPETKHHLGEVFRIGEKIGVATASGVIILEEVQIEGKNNITINDFINGYPDFLGTILK